MAGRFGGRGRGRGRGNIPLIRDDENKAMDVSKVDEAPPLYPPNVPLPDYPGEPEGDELRMMRAWVDFVKFKRNSPFYIHPEEASSGGQEAWEGGVHTAMSRRYVLAQYMRLEPKYVPEELCTPAELRQAKEYAESKQHQERLAARQVKLKETDVDDPLAQLEDRERTGTPSGPGAKKKEGDGSGDEAEADVTMDPGEEEDDEDNDDYYQASAALMRGDE
eukprot:jgi/Astpho2/3053/Aster-x1113